MEIMKYVRFGTGYMGSKIKLISPPNSAKNRKMKNEMKIMKYVGFGTEYMGSKLKLISPQIMENMKFHLQNPLHAFYLKV